MCAFYVPFRNLLACSRQSFVFQIERKNVISKRNIFPTTHYSLLLHKQLSTSFSLSKFPNANSFFIRSFAKFSQSEKQNGNHDNALSKLSSSKEATLSLVEKELSKICSREQDILESKVNTVDAELAQKFLEDSKFVPVKNDENLLSFSRVYPRYTVTVTITPPEEDAQEEEEEEEDNPENQNEQEDPNKDISDLDLTSWIPTQNFTVNISFRNKEGKVKGHWELVCYSGTDNRLYVHAMHTRKESEPESPDTVFLFDALEQDEQDKIYDFLDEIYVDDRLAHFVKYSVLESNRREDIRFFESLKSFLEDN